MTDDMKEIERLVDEFAAAQRGPAKMRPALGTRAALLAAIRRALRSPAPDGGGLVEWLVNGEWDPNLSPVEILDRAVDLAHEVANRRAALSASPAPGEDGASDEALQEAASVLDTATFQTSTKAGNAARARGWLERWRHLPPVARELAPSPVASAPPGTDAGAPTPTDKET